MNQDILYQEIIQQPSIIASLIKTQAEQMREIIAKTAGKYNYVVIAARGTSDNAARYAQYLLGSHNHLQVALATPSLFSLYKTPPFMQGALVIGISQSGQSPDVVSVLSEARKQGCPTLSITNDPNAPLAQASEFVFPLNAGAEIATAATKSYTSSLAALALFSALLSGEKERYQELTKIAPIMQQVLESSLPQTEKIDRYRFMQYCMVIGRGFNYCTAFEVALKIKELSRVIAAGFSSADFQHGPIAVIGKGSPVILIGVKGAAFEDTLRFKRSMQALGAELIIISNQESLLEGGNLPLPIPTDLPEHLSPMVTVLPGQLIARQLTIEKGLDTDHPTGIHKVTETL